MRLVERKTRGFVRQFKLSQAGNKVTTRLLTRGNRQSNETYTLDSKKGTDHNADLLSLCDF